MSIDHWEEFTFSNDKRFLVKDSPFSEKLTEKELQEGFEKNKLRLGGLRTKHIEDNLPDPATEKGRNLLYQALVNMQAAYEKKYETEKKRLLDDFEEKHREAREWFEYEIKAKECEEFLLGNLGKETMKKYEIRKIIKPGEYVETPFDPRTFLSEEDNEKINSSSENSPKN